MKHLNKYFNIPQRIASGYLLIIFVVFATNIWGIIILTKNNSNYKKVFSTSDMPVLSALKDFNFLVSESKKLTNNWIYQPEKSEKEQLKQLQSKTYPDLKAALLSTSSKLNDEQGQKTVSIMISTFDSIIGIQQQIMSKLATDEDYANDVAVDEAITLFQKQLEPKINYLTEQIAGLTDQTNKSLQLMFNLQHEDNAMLSLVLKIMMLFLIIASAVVFYLTLRIITKPLALLKEITTTLGKGEVVENIGELKKRDSLLDGYKTDEIGQMANAIEDLLAGIKHQIIFADEIGKGNYEKEFQLLSDKDTMGKALIEMRNNLKNASEDDKRRNWTTEGLAKFGEILRLNNDNIEVLGNNIISNLVKYLKANQGGLFIVNENKKDDIHLELIACYAFERKKYITKKIAIGEGLVGQTWQEGEYIYLTNVPNDYVHITSGLGGGNPRCILIMPLKINEQTFGVIEIASFKTLEKHEVEFVQKISESIASTVSTTKINERTKRLLEESQQQSEELKSQEEEVRQNMEEMTATQEELQRKENETKKLLEQSKIQEERLRKNMEEIAATQEESLRYKEESEAQRKTTHSMAFFSKTDANGDVIYINDNFLKASKYSSEELNGKNHRMLKSGHHSDEFYKNMWDTISNGKVWRNEIKNKAKDGSYFWVDMVIAPILNKSGEIKEYVSQGFEITDKKKREELLLKELEEFRKVK